MKMDEDHQSFGMKLHGLSDRPGCDGRAAGSLETEEAAALFYCVGMQNTGL